MRHTAGNVLSFVVGYVLGWICGTAVGKGWQNREKPKPGTQKFNQKQTEGLIRDARRNLRNADRTRDNESDGQDRYRSGCFQLQQSAEFALKSITSAREREFTKHHRLQELFETACDADQAFPFELNEDVKRMFRVMSKYATTGKYSDESMDSERNFHDFRPIAGTILDHAEERVQELNKADGKQERQ